MDDPSLLPAGHPRGFRAGGVRRAATTPLDPLVRAALDCTEPGLIIIDPAGGVRLLTRAAADLLGVTMPRAGGIVPIQRLLAQSPWLDEGSLQALSILFAGEDRPDGREALISLAGPGAARIVAVDLRRVHDLGWVAALHDVTQTREEQQWLLEHAATDPVTGLWNRQHFMLMLRDRLETPTAGLASVLLLDMSRSGPITDMLGTPLGDSVLRLVAARLVNMLREHDILARFASDEFAILLSHVPNRTAIAVLVERMTEIVSRPFIIDGHTITIGLHAGAACAPEDGISPESLIAHAGLALSAARAEARGLLRFYEPTLDAQARQRRALETDLRAALPRREFLLHYQPQIDLRQHRIVGMEALVRWRSPCRGLVPPNEFISLAERLGLINDLGAWVLHEACRAATLWPDGITVAVNASPLQVEAGGFAETVAGALAETGLPGARLEVEITENLLLRDNGTVLSTFETLRGLGVRLVLDDFGTGYSSLSQLGRFKFDKIKIDRSFISVPAGTAGDDAILRAIAGLGVSLGVPTTAEGVETEQQLRRCSENGCTSVQGYYFSRPVPEAEIPALLDRFAAEPEPVA